jgi:putative transposase
MARLARIVVPVFPHHVTQRGNRRATVFDDDEARQHYLALFRHYAAKHGLSAWTVRLVNP